jgi:hypothetical protein
MTASASVPNTVEIKRSRLFGGACVVAAAAAGLLLRTSRTGWVVLVAGAVVGLALVMPGVAGAATIPATGTFFGASEGTCGDFVQTGVMFRVHCEGITETWTGDISGTGTFTLDLAVNAVSGEIVGSGSEIFVGCVDANCGTLTWDYYYSGKTDPTTFIDIETHGEQHFTGGTGDLAGESGSVRFSSIGQNPSTYEGHVVL